jgi:uncharacterized membrane protein
MRTRMVVLRAPGHRRLAVVDRRRPVSLKTVGAAGAAAGAGAVAQYLLDPDRGRARRARVRDKTARAAHQMNDGVSVLSRDLSNRGRGIAAGMRYRFDGDGVDDRVVHERVRAELGRYVSHPHAVEVKVDDGVVTVSGHVIGGEDRRAVRALKRVPGVRDVDARWSVHDDVEGVPQLQGDGRPRQPVPELLQQHWSPAARFVAGTGAAAMLTVSARVPTPVAWALRGTGSVLAARAATNLPLRRLTGITAGRRAVDVVGSISVDAPPERIWPLVSDYTAFPQFMPDVREVRRSGNGALSHWEITGPAGVPVRFDAEETKRVEGKEIAWQTIEGQLVAHAGSLRLDPVDKGRTRVQVQLTYNPVAGAVGHAVAKAFGADPAHKMKQDLQRLKSYVETGASPSDAAQPARER